MNKLLEKIYYSEMKDLDFNPLHSNDNKKYKETLYELSPEIKIDDFVDFLDKKMELHVLYAVIVDNNKTDCVMYSIPYDEEMFVVKITSSANDMINKVIISEYKSMDDMYIDLLYTLNYIENKYKSESMNTKVLEKSNAVTLYKNFIQ